MQNKKLNSREMPTILKNMDLPTGELSVEIRKNREVNIRGCLKIEKYTPKLITVSIKSGFLNVTGNDLSCFSYSGRNIGISGKIRCVFFSDCICGGRKC